MTTRCRSRTLLTLMVSLHLSMCHSATSWPPKKQRKGSFENTTRKTLKEMLHSLFYHQEVLGLVKAINRLFRNFPLDPGITWINYHPVFISLVPQLRCLLCKKTNQQYLTCHEISLSLSAKGIILTRTLVKRHYLSSRN